VFRPPQKNAHLCSNCSFCTAGADSTFHRLRSNASGSHDQCALGLQSAHIADNNHHASTPSLAACAIAVSIRLAMICSSMPPMLSPMSQSSIANLALIPVIDIAQCPINHPIPIKVAILCISHLSKTKVFSIWIDCINTPIAFLCNQCVKALHLFPIDNERVCIEL
jgi:hypothetical protein